MSAAGIVLAAKCSVSVQHKTVAIAVILDSVMTVSVFVAAQHESVIAAAAHFEHDA